MKSRVHANAPVRSRRWARGLALQEVLVLMVSIAAIGGVATFIGPRLIGVGSASTIQQSPIEADSELAKVKAMVDASRAVLGVWVEPLTGDTFVTLWGGDPGDPGWINRGEVIVIHHSRIRRVLSAWVCASPSERYQGVADPPPDTRMLRVREADASSPEFGPEWVTAPDTRRLVIGAGRADIREFRVERGARADRTTGFIIGLTRAARTSDGGLQESSVRARPSGGMSPKPGGGH